MFFSTIPYVKWRNHSYFVDLTIVEIYGRDCNYSTNILDLVQSKSTLHTQAYSWSQVPQWSKTPGPAISVRLHYHCLVTATALHHSRNPVFTTHLSTSSLHHMISCITWSLNHAIHIQGNKDKFLDYRGVLISEEPWFQVPSVCIQLHIGSSQDQLLKQPMFCWRGNQRSIRICCYEFHCIPANSRYKVHHSCKFMEVKLNLECER